METITICRKEIISLEGMQNLVEKHISQKEAGAIVGVSEQPFKRLLKVYRVSRAERKSVCRYQTQGVI